MADGSVVLVDRFEAPMSAHAHGAQHGRMGMFELLSTVLAFSAPVAVVSGYIPIVIAFDGIGAPLVFLLSMVLLLLFAVGFTTMTRYVPRPGGFYAYITAGLGRAVGLGASLLAIFGYLLCGFSTFPFFGTNMNALVSETFSGPSIAWYWYALGCWGACAVLSYLKIDLSAKVLSVAMFLEVGVVTIFNVSVLRHGGPEGLSLRPLYWTSFTSGAVGMSILFGVSCFLGFEATAIFRDEVVNPKKTVPRATYLAVLLIGLFYALAAWTTVCAFGIDKAAAVATQNPGQMFPTAMAQFVGKLGVDVTRVLLASSLFAAALSGQNIVARYVFSLGMDRVLPTALGRLHPKHRSPYVAAMVVSVGWLLTGLLFVILGTDPTKLYARAAGVGGFAVLLLLMLTSAAVVVFFRRSLHLGDTTVWHTLVAPVSAMVALAAVVFLAVKNFPLLIDGSAGEAAVLLGVTFGVFLIGMVLAAIYRRTSPDIYRRIGRQTV